MDIRKKVASPILVGNKITQRILPHPFIRLDLHSIETLVFGMIFSMNYLRKIVEIKQGEHMKKTEDVTEILNELLMINNDRIGIYRMVVRKIGEHDLKVVFQDAIRESKRIQSTLSLEIFKRNSLPNVDGTTWSGKLYLFWLEVKDLVNITDEDSVNDACKFSEFCVEKAYQEALKNDEVYGELGYLLNQQIETLRRSHQILRNYSLSY